MFGNVPFDDSFALPVRFGHCSEFVLETFRASFRAHPLNAVEPLLKKIVRAWREVVLLPQSEPVDYAAVGLAEIST